MSKIQKIPERKRAAHMIALHPEFTDTQIAGKLSIHPATITRWKQDPNFVDMIYDLYMIEFGSEIPSVLKAMVREAKAGNVQAGRLVLEHSGKLVKNINITIDSPFEKFLKAEDTEVEYMDAEVQDIVDDIPDIPDVVLPERSKEDQSVRTERENRSINHTIRAEKRKLSRNKMYRWKVRARAVGIDELPDGRPTKATKVQWIKLIEEKEEELRRKK